MDDLSFLDHLRTKVRLFLMGNREIIAIFGVLFLTVSVIYSSKIITFPTRVPTRAIGITPMPTPFLKPSPVPTITATSSGFLELLQLSPIPSITPTPAVPDVTIFLPPLPR